MRKKPKDMANQSRSSSKTKKQPQPHNDFSATDFTQLSQNEYNRYQNNSQKIGHAVIKEAEDGKEIAYQYEIPCENRLHVRPLSNIEAIERYGSQRYRATSPNGTPFFATRFIDVAFKETPFAVTEKMRIASFSPAPKDRSEPFWGSHNQTQLFSEGNSEYKQALDAEIESIGLHFKGGRELSVEGDSVRHREENKTKRDQNKIMGESAQQCYKAFFDQWAHELHPNMQEILQRAIDAPLNKTFKGNYRPEWLHLEGHSLTPMSIDPQRKDNLAAGPKWANTEMMVLERIAKWFALNRPDAYIKIKPEFEMLFDSELAKKINFEVSIEEKNRFIRLLQEIDPFIKYPLFRKASDVAQGTAVVSHLLNGTPPARQQMVIQTQIAEKSEDESKKPIIKHKPKEKIYPTTSQYQASVVQVLTTFNEADFDSPWKGVDTGKCTGTGIVIENEGQIYILTNAHCVENAVMVRVRLANDRRKKFVAKAKCVSYQCDLALLEVDDPEFTAQAIPAQIGDMISLRKKVYTVGFPMGGSEVSITKGIVSRIETGEYCISGEEMLHVQVDSAINSGNSGGPVFSSDGRVAGVAFQGVRFAQSLGYMIPAPIIKHFLKEAFNGKAYRGFPILPIRYQALENPALREFYGLSKTQSGIRIKSIAPLSDANHKLYPDDILLELDSYVISNEGTVDIPGIGNCIDFNHITHMKFIGDTVLLKVLRKDVEDIFKIYTISIVLDHVPGEASRVLPHQHDSMPTYFIASGIALVPLTQDYLDQGGADLADCYIAEEGCLVAHAPKRVPGEQIIVVNDVLDCEETQGYGNYRNAIIKEINGKQIYNIWDAVIAIEQNDRNLHHMTTASKKKIVVKRMNAAKHAELLACYKIPFDRSEDLRAPSPKISLDDVLISEDEAGEISLPILQSGMPGLQKYQQTVSNMLAHYSAFPDDESDDEDYQTEAESCSPSASEAEEASSEEASQPSRRHNVRFFAAFNESSSESEVSPKRKKIG